jgi:hypothetical protein
VHKGTVQGRLKEGTIPQLLVVAAMNLRKKESSSMADILIGLAFVLIVFGPSILASIQQSRLGDSSDQG